MLLLGTHPHSQSASQRVRDSDRTLQHEEQPQGRVARGGDEAFLRDQGRGQQPRDEEGIIGWMPRLLRGPGPPPRGLTSLEDVEFLVPADGGIEGENGEVMTESQQAAAFVNNMADSAAPAGIAADLGLGVLGLDFAGMVFYHGSEFPIEKEFDFGSVELSNVRGICDQDSHLGPAGTWIFALLLGALAALVVACPCLYLERVYLDKYRILLAWLDGPTPRHFGGNSSTVSAMTTRTKLATINEEGEGDVYVPKSAKECQRVPKSAATTTARGGGGSFLSRRVRLGGAARKYARNAVVPRSELVNSVGMRRQRRRQQRRWEADDFSLESIDSFDMKQQHRRWIADDGAKSDSDDSNVSQGQFRHRNPMCSRKETGSGLSFEDLAQHYDGGGGDSSSERSSRLACAKDVYNPMFGRGENPPSSRKSKDEYCRGHGKLEPGRQAEQTKPAARVATGAPRSYSRSYSEPDLPSVDEQGTSERGVSGVDFPSSSASRGHTSDVGGGYGGSDRARGCTSARGSDDNCHRGTTTAPRATTRYANSRWGSHSSFQYARPVQPLLGGGSTSSSSRSLSIRSQPRSGSFGSPAGRAQDSFGRPASSLDSPVSDKDDYPFGRTWGSVYGSGQDWERRGGSPLTTSSYFGMSSRASSDPLNEEHGDSDSDSTSNSLTYSVSTSTSTTQQESPQHEQRRDQSSPPILGGRPSDTYEGSDDAGDGGGGGDAQSSVLTDEPDAWSSWAKDEVSDGTQPVGATGRRGTWYYCFWNE